jgi:hypothetical protein
MARKGWAMCSETKVSPCLRISSLQRRYRCRSRFSSATEETLQHHADDAAVDGPEDDRQQRPGEQLGSESAL